MNNNSFASGQTSNLIIPVSYFVNHIKQRNALKENLAKYKIASIVGTSGIGKTQITRIYAYENRKDYNIIWFLDCNLDLNKEFVKLARELNRSNNANLTEDANTAKKEVMDYLAHQEKWLLVFDNLKINENKKVQDLVNWEHNGNVIFCSQDSETLPHTIEITSLDQNNTITLIDNLLENKDQNSVDFLVKEFKGYPVLIVQGAQILNKIKGLSKEDYKKRIHEAADKIKLNVAIATNELKPTARRLLNKIALINNHSFSKQILRVITDDVSSIDDDIYNLSKFILISNTNSDEQNPVFEMYDIVTEEILNVNGKENNKLYLEEIINNIANARPKYAVQNLVFSNAKTMHENLEVLLKNTQKYGVNLGELMKLSVGLLADYLNTEDHENAEKQVKWFEEQDKQKKFKIWLMSNNEKAIYAGYLSNVGVYYRCMLGNNSKAIEYFTAAKKVLDNLEGHEGKKCNAMCNLTASHILLGELQKAKRYIEAIEDMIDKGQVDKSEIGRVHSLKARLLYHQGNYDEALLEEDKAIEVYRKQGIWFDDLVLTDPYILRATILNALGKYQAAYTQIKQVYSMHAANKREQETIFAQIFTQKARAELGLREVDKALNHVTKAIVIFLNDERRNPREADYSEDPDLAVSYVVQGDIFFAQDKAEEAIQSYKKAQLIYFYLYKDRSKNEAHVSYLYMQGAKAACKLKDLYNYKFFGKPQIREFGIDHPNTVAMFEYCKLYSMDLWAKEN